MGPVVAIPLMFGGMALVKFLASMGSAARAGRTPLPSPSPQQPEKPREPLPTPPADDDEPTTPTTPTDEHEDEGPVNEPDKPPPPAPEPPPDEPDQPPVPTPTPAPSKLTLEQLVANFMGAARARDFMAWVAATLTPQQRTQLDQLVAALPSPPGFDAMCATLSSVVLQTLSAAQAVELVGKFPEWKPILEKCAITMPAPAPNLPPAPTPEDVEPEGPVTPTDEHEDDGPVNEPDKPPPPAPEPPPDEPDEPPVPTPEPTPQPGNQPPAGFNWQHAASTARGVANDLGEHGIEHYSHAKLKAWQSVAGIEADGVYGGQSRGALAHYLDNRVPQPFFKPTATEPYKWASLVPQGAGLNPSQVVTPAPAPTPPDDDEDGPHDEPQEPPPPAPSPPPDDGDADVGPVPPAGFNPPLARSLAVKVAKTLDRGRGFEDRELIKKFQAAAGIDADGIYGGQSRGALIHYGIKRPPGAFYKPVQTVPYKWAEQAGGATP